jgi:hypothetical protein
MSTAPVRDRADPFANTEPWLTKRELASALKLSMRTIERLITPTMRAGGQNRYKLSDAERQLQGDRGRPADLVELRP